MFEVFIKSIAHFLLMFFILQLLQSQVSRGGGGGSLTFEGGPHSREKNPAENCIFRSGTRV